MREKPADLVGWRRKNVLYWCDYKLIDKSNNPKHCAKWIKR